MEDSTTCSILLGTSSSRLHKATFSFQPMHPELLEHTSPPGKPGLQMVQSYPFKYYQHADNPKCVPPAWISPQDSRLVHLIAYLAIPCRCVMAISDSTDPCSAPTRPPQNICSLGPLPFNSVRDNFFFPAARCKAHEPPETSPLSVMPHT